MHSEESSGSGPAAAVRIVVILTTPTPVLDQFVKHSWRYKIIKYSQLIMLPILYTPRFPGKKNSHGPLPFTVCQLMNQHDPRSWAAQKLGLQ